MQNLFRMRLLIKELLEVEAKNGGELGARKAYCVSWAACKRVDRG